MFTKLYIATIHLNDFNAFSTTARSIAGLSGAPLEWKWIIKDGKSTPACLGAIENYLKNIPKNRYCFVTKADLGIYDAMNQIIEIIEDDNALCLFLNSGDQLTEDFIDYLKASLSSFTKHDIIYGDYSKLCGNNLVIHKAPSTLDFAYLLGRTINHQSILIKVKWLKKYPFKPEYKVVADWVQLFLIFKYESLKAKYLPLPIAIYQGGGFSEKNDLLRLQERNQFIKSLYSEWEIQSLNLLSRMRSRAWFSFILKSVDSPKRSFVLSIISKLCK